MIRQVTKNTLQPPTRLHVLRIVEIKESGVVLMEGSDGARCVRTIIVYILTLDYPAMLAYPVIYSPTRIPSLFGFATEVIKPDEPP